MLPKILYFKFILISFTCWKNIENSTNKKPIWIWRYKAPQNFQQASFFTWQTDNTLTNNEMEEIGQLSLRADFLLENVGFLDKTSFEKAV